MVNIDSKIRTYWPELQKQFPGFEKPQVVPGDAIRREARIHHLAYMVDQVDQDPTALYIFIKGDPRKGPCDRNTAVDFYYNLMSVKGQPIPSSFEDEYGVDPHAAADLEVLPRPADDRQKYGNDGIFGEFMRQFREEAVKQARLRKDREFQDKYGFDRNDPDIIDVPAGDGQALPPPAGNAVEKAAGNAVGAPKPIMYCVVLHPGFGANELGYDGRRHDLGNRGGHKQVREEDDCELTEREMDDMMKEAENMNEDANYYGQFAQIHAALRGIEKAIRDRSVDTAIRESILAECDAIKAECEKCGDPECKDGEICGLKEEEPIDEAYLSQEDSDDIADMFAGYSSGSLSTSGRSQLMGFMQMHGDELKKLARQASQANGLGDFSRARDLGNDDLDESKDKSDEEISETEEEINEIIGEDGESDTEKAIDEYSKIEDDVDEDDEMLSESVIRHATMLAREVW